MYYDECPICGATLDPNEKCDCGKDDKDGRACGTQSVDGRDE